MLFISESERYSIQIFQLYALTSSVPDKDIEEFYGDISRASISEKANYKSVDSDLNDKLGMKTENRNKIEHIVNLGVSLMSERGDQLTNHLEWEKM